MPILHLMKCLRYGACFSRIKTLSGRGDTYVRMPIYDKNKGLYQRPYNNVAYFMRLFADGINMQYFFLNFHRLKTI